MASVGTHGLFCIEPENYAAFALYMQCLAEQIDATLTAQQADIDAFLNRPTMIVTSAINKTWTFPNSSRTDIFDTVLFNNSAALTFTSGVNGAINIGSPISTPNPITYPTGLWMVGGTTRMATAGASNPNGLRTLQITVTDDTIPPSGQQVAQYRDQTTAFGVLDSQTVKGPVILRGSSGVRVTGVTSSTDLLATGNVTVQAGALMWVTYVGPDELVEVA